MFLIVFVAGYAFWPEPHMKECYDYRQNETRFECRVYRRTARTMGQTGAGRRDYKLSPRIACPLLSRTFWTLSTPPPGATDTIAYMDS